MRIHSVYSKPHEYNHSVFAHKPRLGLGKSKRTRVTVVGHLLARVRRLC